jgi:hypothetical protein
MIEANMDCDKAPEIQIKRLGLIDLGTDDSIL